MKTIDFSCAEYRKEMMLVQLRQKFNCRNLNPDEKKVLEKEIENLEMEMGLR
jgi:hypothetical protein